MTVLVARLRRPVLFGVRMWISATLALFLAFWLELDEPGWAATSAMIACQPQVGASIRRGWFRIIGTLTGAVMSLLFAAAAPQDRITFLVCMTLWAGCAAFASTLLRNFASYAAALSGYTVAIIGGGALGATGGIRSVTVFNLACSRSSEIILGIVCTGVVLTLSDVGDAAGRLTASLAELSSQIMTRIMETLSPSGARQDMQQVRRDLLRRVIALDPVIDQALGETSRFRLHSPVLQRAVDGLFCALASWRTIDTHLVALPPEDAKAGVALLRMVLPDETSLHGGLADPLFWASHPRALRATCLRAMAELVSLQAPSPSMRLLADKVAEFLCGMVYALGGLRLLTDPGRPEPVRGGKRLRIADALPALLNALRTIVVVGVAALGWVVTGWTEGVSMLTFAMLMSILMGPRDAAAYSAARYFTLGAFLAAILTIVVNFALIPSVAMTFPVLAIVMASYIVPLAALSQAALKPWVASTSTTMTTLFSPLLSPTNPMTFDASGHFNSTLAIIAGCLLAIVGFRMIPPFSPRFVTSRLLRLTLRDLRRLAGGRLHEDWNGHMFGRLSAMPPQASPLERAWMVVALSVGQEIQQLRALLPAPSDRGALERALAALRRGEVRVADERLRSLGGTLAERAQTQAVLRARAGMMVIAEALRRHPAFFTGRDDA